MSPGPPPGPPPQKRAGTTTQDHPAEYAPTPCHNWPGPVPGPAGTSVTPSMGTTGPPYKGTSVPTVGRDRR